MAPQNRVEPQSHSTVEFGKPRLPRNLEDFIQEVATPAKAVSGLTDVPTGGGRSRVASSTEPPLPPPPNPVYVQAGTSPAPVLSPDAPVPPLDVPAAVALPSASSRYDEQTTGALTVYNYYLEESQSFPAATAASPSGRPQFPKVLVGAGAVAATVVSGLVIGDAWQKSQVPEADTQPQEASGPNDAARKAAQNLPRPTTVAPERQDLERSPVNSNPLPAKRPPVTPRKTSSRQPLDALPAPALPPMPAIAAPETLAVRSPIAPAPMPSQATQSPPPKTSWVAANIPQVSVAEAARRQSAVASVSPPESLPAGGTPSSAAMSPSGTPLPPFAPGANPAPLPAPPLNSPLASTPQGGDAPAIAAPAAPTPLSPQVEATAPAPTAATGGLQSLFPARPDSVPAGDRGTPAPVQPSGDTTAQFTPERAAAPTANAVPSRPTPTLQEYINLPKASSGTAAVSLMPLSQQAAVEAGNTSQVGAFAVRQVSPQDYQKEWLASNPTVEDPAIALAFPAYGFIDYQRQVIIVLQERSATAPMQSQRPTSPSS